MANHLISVELLEDCEIVCSQKTSGKHKDEFEWVCCDGELEINFNKNGSPFANGSVFTSHGGHPTRPKAKVKDTGAVGSYDYTVTVRRGGKTCVLDPQIIIEDTAWRDWNPEWLHGFAAMAAGASLLVWGVKKLLTVKGEEGRDLERKV